MTLSGDDLTKIPPDRLAMLRRLLPPTGVAAEFEDDSLRVGIVKLTGRRMVCLFNWGETAQTLSFRLTETEPRARLMGEDLGRRQDLFTAKDMAPRSARLFECLPTRPLEVDAFKR